VSELPANEPRIRFSDVPHMARIIGPRRKGKKLNIATLHRWPASAFAEFDLSVSGRAGLEDLRRKAHCGDFLRG